MSEDHEARQGTGVGGIPPRRDVRELSKTFVATKALDNVSFWVDPGEVHAIVGHNGSGKSTLAKVLSGYHKPDGGWVAVDGAPIELPARPKELHERGMSFVHQDLGLIGHLSVTENIRLTAFGRHTFRINWRREEEAAAATLSRLGAQIDPRTVVRDLAPAERALVAIARALQNHRAGAGLMILDESTRSLPRHALEAFYGTLLGLRAEGTSILMVSHKLDEVFAVADHVTVLRNGCVVASCVATRELTKGDLAKLILGVEQAEEVRTRSAPTSGTRRVVVTGLRGPEVDGISFALRESEIVGLTGLPGSGHERVPYLLAGAAKAEAGTCVIDGSSVSLAGCGISEMLGAGVALVPESRADEGVALTLSIGENLTIPRVTTRGKAYLTGEEWQKREIEEAIAALHIIPPDPHRAVGLLSGGNQQKVLVAKWLLNRPTLFLLHEPAQGIDIGARLELLRVIQETAAAGSCVLLVSTEPDDLAALSDRLLVMSDGDIVLEMQGPLTADDVVNAIYDSTREEQVDGAPFEPAEPVGEVRHGHR